MTLTPATAHTWQPRWNRLRAVNFHYPELFARDPALWTPALDKTLYDLFPEARAEIPPAQHASLTAEARAAPDYNPHADPDSPGWADAARRAETCPHRTAVVNAGCCGPRYHCINGRHDGMIAEPIAICVQCIRELDARTAP
jgi:hypothetical protein